MSAIQSDLEGLRRRIDEIDDRLQDLLIERIDIVAVDAQGKPLGPGPVERSASSVAHVPRPSAIIDAGTPHGKEMRAKRGKHNERLIRNVITIDRGTIRARQLVTWDEGRFPLDGAAGAGASPAGTATAATAAPARAPAASSRRGGRGRGTTGPGPG